VANFFHLQTALWSQNHIRCGRFFRIRMTNSTNPAKLSRDQRIQELATILARGIIRLLDPDNAAKSSEIKAQNLPTEP
jgi:hypothetical protein